MSDVELPTSNELLAELYVVRNSLMNRVSVFMLA